MGLQDTTVTPAKDYTAQQLWEYLHTKFQMQSGISTTLNVQQLISFMFVNDRMLKVQLN